MRKYMRSLGFRGRAELFVRNWVGIDVDDLAELTEEQAKRVVQEARNCTPIPDRKARGNP